jgi:hypothetical protein
VTPILIDSDILIEVSRGRDAGLVAKWDKSRPEPSRARVFARHSGRALAWSTAAGAQDSGRPLRGHPVRSYQLGNRAACRRLPQGVCEEPQRRIGRRADRGNGFHSRLGAVDSKSPSLSNEGPCLLLSCTSPRLETQLKTIVTKRPCNMRSRQIVETCRPNRLCLPKTSSAHHRSRGWLCNASFSSAVAVEKQPAAP